VSPPGGARVIAAFPGGVMLALCACWVAAVVVAGCGGSSRAVSPPKASVCPAGARAAVADFLGVHPGSVSAVPGTSSQATPECVLRAALLAGAVARVTVTIDSAPQAYFRLERTAVEAEQVFGAVREEPAPVNVSRLGLDAYWFPGERQVMTTDGVRLITAAIEWPQVPAGKRRALAVVAARPFLGKLHPKAADPGGS
jgi:hypothetical protein